MLRIAELTCRFGGVTALDRVSMDVAAGAVVGIIGPNGAGKSTFLSAVGGQARPRGGTIVLDGHRIERLPAHARFGRGLVRTFQLPRPFRRLTVRENLLVVPARHPADQPRRAAGLLASLQLERLADRSAGELSGGQQKLLDVARALMARPRVLLLDEPCAGVTPALVEVLSAALAVLRGEGVTTLIVEHRLDFLEQHCDDAVALVNGAVLARGTLAAVRADPAVQGAFLGAGHG